MALLSPFADLASSFSNDRVDPCETLAGLPASQPWRDGGEHLAVGRVLRPCGPAGGDTPSTQVAALPEADPLGENFSATESVLPLSRPRVRSQAGVWLSDDTTSITLACACSKGRADYCEAARLFIS